MSLMAPAATPEKRKRSVTSAIAPQRSPKMARQDSLTSTADESPDSAIHYGVYMHDLLKDSGSAVSRLITVSEDFTSAYEAMRKHAAGEIEANVHWGATTELNTNNLYEILDSRNRILLRYELDAVSSVRQDANGDRIWQRASASPALPVHYGMYIDLHCDTRDEAEHFFIGGFKSLGEANHAMKQSAAMYLQGHGETKLYDKSIELSGNGSFLRVEDWPLEQGSTDSKVPVLRLPIPETSKLSEPPTAQTAVPQIVAEFVVQGRPQDVQNVPAPVISEPQAVQSIRRQSQRHQTPIPPADETKQKQPKTRPQAKPKAPAKSETTAQRKSQPKTQVQTAHDPNPYCSCRLPDDGSLMVCCDNEQCPVGWYHGRCINIRKAIPEEEEEWYCEMCTREREKEKARGMNTLAGKTPVKTSGKKAGRGDAKAKGKAKKGKSS
ncbi:hypothetical protein AA0113_g459 [Alternaria arborescens]|uniref:Zinc finger PHD-type domain-containing protein n=1 Tax=Alternaria arborescens TaxID=156630 RepID=A0A4Q4SPW7_9PLEO|nr:hypothetical protein AA0113_g459 [Alternaria arborescens]